MASVAEVTARISADVSGLVRGVQQGTMALGQIQMSAQKASNSLRKVFEFAGGMMLYSAISKVTDRMRGFADEAVKAAGRVDEMNLVLTVLGNNAGYTFKQLDDQVQKIRQLGIEYGVAQKAVADFTRRNLDMSKAADLARVAQDAAVIAAENSSQTLDRLMWGIQTRQVEVLRTAGIQVSFEQEYQKYAASIGKTVSALNEQEKTQAALNAVIQEGTKLQGAYDMAMRSPAKAARSIAREINDIAVALGQHFQPAYYDVINTIRKGIEGDGKGGLAGIVSSISEGGKWFEPLERIGAAVSVFIDRIKQALEALRPFGEALGELATGSAISFFTRLGQIVQVVAPALETIASQFRTMMQDISVQAAPALEQIGDSLVEIARILSEALADMSNEISTTVVMSLSVLADALSLVVANFATLIDMLDKVPGLLTAFGVIAGLELVTHMTGLDNVLRSMTHHDVSGWVGVAVKSLYNLIKTFVTATAAAMGFDKAMTAMETRRSLGLRPWQSIPKSTAAGMAGGAAQAAGAVGTAAAVQGLAGGAAATAGTAAAGSAAVTVPGVAGAFAPTASGLLVPAAAGVGTGGTAGAAAGAGAAAAGTTAALGGLSAAAVAAPFVIAIGVIGTAWYIGWRKAREQHRKLVDSMVEDMERLSEAKGLMGPAEAIEDQARKVRFYAEQRGRMEGEQATTLSQLKAVEGEYPAWKPAPLPVVNRVVELREQAGKQTRELDFYKEQEKSAIEALNKYWEAHRGSVRDTIKKMIADQEQGLQEREAINAEIVSLIGQQGKAYVDLKEMSKLQLQEVDRTLGEIAAETGKWAEKMAAPSGYFEQLKEDETASAQGLQDFYKNQLAKVENFYQNIRALQTRGVDTGLIKEFLQAGPEAVGKSLEQMAKDLASKPPEFQDAWVESINAQYSGIQRAVERNNRNLIAQMLAGGEGAFLDQTPERVAQWASQQTELGFGVKEGAAGIATLTEGAAATALEGEKGRFESVPEGVKKDIEDWRKAGRDMADAINDGNLQGFRDAKRDYEEAGQQILTALEGEDAAWAKNLVEDIELGIEDSKPLFDNFREWLLRQDFMRDTISQSFEKELKAAADQKQKAKIVVDAVSTIGLQVDPESKQIMLDDANALVLELIQMGVPGAITWFIEADPSHALTAAEQASVSVGMIRAAIGIYADTVPAENAATDLTSWVDMLTASITVGADTGPAIAALRMVQTLMQGIATNESLPIGERLAAGGTYVQIERGISGLEGIQQEPGGFDTNANWDRPGGGGGGGGGGEDWASKLAEENERYTLQNLDSWKRLEAAVNDYKLTVNRAKEDQKEMWESFSERYAKPAAERLADIRQQAQLASQVLSSGGKNAGALKALAAENKEVRALYRQRQDLATKQQRIEEAIARRKAVIELDYRWAVAKANKDSQSEAEKQFRLAEAAHQQNLALLDLEIQKQQELAGIVAERNALDAETAEVARQIQAEALAAENQQASLSSMIGTVMKEWLYALELTGEQMQTMIGNITSLFEAVREGVVSAFDVTTRGGINAIVRGRGMDRLEKWLDGIQKLAQMGLNPILLRQIIDAGPDSLRAVEKLISDPKALQTINQRFARAYAAIDNVTGRLISNRRDLIAPETYQDPQLRNIILRNRTPVIAPQHIEIDGVQNIVTNTQTTASKSGMMQKDISDLIAANQKYLPALDKNTANTVAAINNLRSSFTPRATGGPVGTMKPYLVGEKGAEIVVPRVSGYVLPAHVTKKILQDRSVSKEIKSSTSTIRKSMIDAKKVRDTKQTIVNKLAQVKDKVTDRIRKATTDRTKLVTKTTTSVKSQTLRITELQKAASAGIVTPRALGGSAPKSKPLLVGERGPEIVVPKVSGVILPAEVTKRIMRDTKVSKEFKDRTVTLRKSSTIDLRKNVKSAASKVTSLKKMVDRTTVEARALGGPVVAGRPYLVGERGKEMFVSGRQQSSMMMQPAHQQPTGNTVTINNDFHVQGDVGEKAIDQFMDVLSWEMKLRGFR